MWPRKYLQRTSSSSDWRSPTQLEQSDSELRLVLEHLIQFWLVVSSNSELMFQHLFMRISRVERPSPPRRETPAVARREVGVSITRDNRVPTHQVHRLRAHREAGGFQRARDANGPRRGILEDVVDDDSVTHDGFGEEVVGEIAASGKESEV